MKKTFLKVLIAIVAVFGVFSLVSCSKYKGFKKLDSGIYAQFYGDIHDTAYQPQTGDLVGIFMKLYTDDTTFIPMVPQQMIMDSLYKGDFFDALRSMHVDDSATFIFNGQEFFEKMFNGAQEWTFGDAPLKADIKLFGVMKKADVEKAQAEYEAQLEERRVQEVTDIDNYLSENTGFKPTESGVYIKSLKKGNGAAVQPMQTVKVNYVGTFLNGDVFDSSVARNEPFEFTVGKGEVIPGWDATVSTMRVGDKVKVLIPSAMAYGEGRPSIPPYSPLLFEIELLEIVE